MKYSNRSPWKKYLASPFALVALLIILGIMIRSTWNINQKANAGATRLEQAQTEFSKLEDRKNDLSGKVSRLSTEEGLEAEIRTKYRAVKEGESVAVLVDDQTAAIVTATTTVKVGWFRGLLHWFGF